MPVEPVSAKISVKVHPGAGRNEILTFTNGVFHIRIAAPPVKGKANKELVEFLADTLDISRSRVIIEHGLSGKNKSLTIHGLVLEAVTIALVKLIKHD